MASFSMSVLSSSSSSASSPRLSNSRVIKRHVPSASLSLLTGSRRDSSISVCAATSGMDSRSGLLHCSLLPSRFSSLSLGHSLSGSSLGLDLKCNISLRNVKRRGLVVRAGKAALCQTKRSRSRKSLARTHGFRLRMRTTRGRATIKRRRAKGRWNLCPKSNPSSGKRA